jgi:hypothetical protein
MVAGSVEVRWLEPRFKGLLSCEPFIVEHGEPGGVVARAFDHHVLAKDAFKGEAEALGGAAAGPP